MQSDADFVMAVIGALAIAIPVCGVVGLILFLI